MAGSRTYRTKAIVLDKTKLKETDLILTLVGESGRQIRAVAKGARKPGSRLAARCEPSIDWVNASTWIVSALTSISSTRLRRFARFG